MPKFVITTENTADLPQEYYQQHNIEYMYLPCTIDGKVYNKDNALSSKEFYAIMRDGAMPTTSQVNSEDAKAVWVPMLEAGQAILHLSFSSALSGTYNSCRIAAEELREEYPECKLIVIDSVCASLGQGMFVDKAVKMRDEEKSIDEVADFLEQHKTNFCHVFTVDDLHHLHRGGRVSKMAALIGTMINLKPILHVDNEGKLIPVNKVRGRKKSLLELISMMQERTTDYTDEPGEVFVSHGDCLEDAEFVAKNIKEKLGREVSIINPIGATIGAHAGPGTVALFFMGTKR
jgi:EDD domain protein, DegV family